MCNICNQNNCNCNTCQECNNSCPTQTCVTTCTCSTDQFTEECPNGLISSSCVIYTGDTLKDCEDEDYIFRGTTLNVFLADLWDTVKCAVTGTSSTILYDGSNILDCEGATLVTTGTTLTNTINQLWDEIKCWYNDLSDLVAFRQPVWQGSTAILVGTGETAPYNVLTTALTEISKYHFNSGEVTIVLKDGVHTLSNGEEFNKLQTRRINVTSENGNTNCFLTSSSVCIQAVSNYINFTDLTITSSGINQVVICTRGSNVVLTDCIVRNSATAIEPILSCSENSELRLVTTSLVNNATAVINIIYSSDFGKILSTDTRISNLGNSYSTAFAAASSSQMEIINTTSMDAIALADVGTAFSVALNSSISIYSYKNVSYNNINFFIQTTRNSDVVYIGETSLGVLTTTTINGRGYTFAGNTTVCIASTLNSKATSTPLIINKFGNVVSANTFSSISANIVATDINAVSVIENNSVFITRDCSVTTNGSVGFQVDASSTLNAIGLQVLGNTGLNVKVIANYISNVIVGGGASNVNIGNSTINTSSVLV